MAFTPKKERIMRMNSANQNWNSYSFGRVVCERYVRENIFSLKTKYGWIVIHILNPIPAFFAEADKSQWINEDFTKDGGRQNNVIKHNLVI